MTSLPCPTFSFPSPGHGCSLEAPYRIHCLGSEKYFSWLLVENESYFIYALFFTSLGTTGRKLEILRAVTEIRILVFAGSGFPDFITVLLHLQNYYV